MPGSMAPLKKPRNTTELPLALNPLKSKDVLAVLAERNQAIVPVGAWVEPAPPDSSAVPASTSAYLIEEELKEQLRKKQEALKRFQRQVKRRVNQQIRLRKKQQLQRSYEAAEKEGSIAMHSSDPAYLTLKRTSVFPNHLNAAIGSARLPPSQKLEDGIEDRENQNELFQQQAQALSQTMKEARQRLASFKTVNKKNASVFPDDRKKNFPTQEEPDTEQSSSIMIDKKGKKNLSWGDQQNLLFEDKDIPFSTVQKVQFKNPLFAVMEEEEVKQLHQDVLPEAQDYLPEAQGDLLQTQGDLTGVCSVELEAQSVELRLSAQDIDLEGQAVEPKTQAVKTKTQSVTLKDQSVELEDGNIVLEGQAFEPKAQAVKTKTQSVMLKDQNVELEDGNIVLEVQDFLLQNQAFLPTDQHILPKDQNVLPKCQDQDFLPTDQHVLPKDQNVQPKCQDQDFLPRDQKANLKPPASILIGRSGGEVFPLDVHQDLLHRHQDQAFINSKKVRFKESYCDMTNEKGREDFPLAGYQYLPPKLQDQAFIRDQNKCIKQPSSFEKWEIERGVASGVPSSLRSIQQPSVGTAERQRAGLLPAGHQHLPPKHQREAFSSRQVGGEYQSGLNTEFQTPLALQSGVSQEEDKKERQKQYLRYRRLFMDIEREQVKEQQRQKEQRKKIEKIKKKKEQQRYAEEQRILRMNFREEPYSGEKMSEILAQLQLEEVQGAREKQQKEKEYQRYVEALKAQIQEKMQLYNITLPPLCCCGPDFWDAHPDTCANNCIFYKNHKAYTRALHSVINSCDIPEGNSTLRVAIHNFASAHRRTLKNL
ncbi:coiled-coil domain-containing protein 15 isoform X1 [Balaenoptera musculus]|uniref:Coiled-coil domain-containing protein 15 isoform X1 n=1 Tax=Balaenoptera musculus TaxID=9771 RepID=A0A8B8Y1R3_BALMU|nr:coiled-coil domain-containing protein 15 isoform X1 [Balaenoptera musculus]XP_036715813.1 coiled-coil domain-containing protein 15 isoform X1 [Balaenoptera musculus]XP_036715814.1 coiled-coil domain-containing protein 15 isoform X1 [Balaenoptera musculus]